MGFSNLAASIRDLTDSEKSLPATLANLVVDPTAIVRYQDGNNIMLINMYFSIESETLPQSQNKSKTSMLLGLKI